MSVLKKTMLARIAWLYYINKKTQEQIASIYNISRPSVQRYLNQALNSKIVITRINHKNINECMELSEQLTDRFNLKLCDIAPSHPNDTQKEIISNLGEVGAQIMERFIRNSKPITVALGSGSTLQECIDRIDSFNRPEHNITSLAGMTTPEGTPSKFDLVTSFAQKTRSRRYYLPAPLVLPSSKERSNLQSLSIYRVVESLSLNADVTFVSISPLLNDSPFRREGFIDKDELNKLKEKGACGEILGQVFDEKGLLIQSAFNERLAGVRINPPTKRLIVGISGSPAKHLPLLASLRGKWINGLVTDEQTARYLLQH